LAIAQEFSHGVEDLIEVEGVVPVSYFLEVSSPGIDRLLCRKKDFEKFKGSDCEIKNIQVRGRQK